ncbi:hypothetical protein ACPOL_6701 [Acidisarcina polymorpha]|uniref:Uncharacterized protein n=1 Tax=Acidisarcina polymorpha TaxID=2211140 RepID=A0A2Z5G9I7_9BACT|nr:hypothetical protein [Acidisarcina polymorpha]AXC15913.1 hypothetical protein ACPOL_6701 [Acidisarcina polymorpha]
MNTSTESSKCARMTVKLELSDYTYQAATVVAALLLVLSVMVYR